MAATATSVALAQRQPDVPPSLAHILDPAAKPPSFTFTFDDHLRREYRFGVDPDRPICKAFKEGHCPLGNSCLDKHPPQSNFSNVVCKHWLRALCKKGDVCEFQHEYNLRKMPDCTTYNRYQACPNGDDCLYAHVDPEAQRPLCPSYEKGFCPLGPLCADRHVKKSKICRYYLAGFCPDGRTCKNGAHPKWKDEVRKPKLYVFKTAEELEREKEDREREAVAEIERERDREERGLPPERGAVVGMQQKFGGGGGRGGWHGRKKRGDRGGGGGGDRRKRGGY